MSSKKEQRFCNSQEAVVNRSIFYVDFTKQKNRRKKKWVLVEITRRSEDSSVLDNEN